MEAGGGCWGTDLAVADDDGDDEAVGHGADDADQRQDDGHAEEAVHRQLSSASATGRLSRSRRSCGHRVQTPRASGPARRFALIAPPKAERRIGAPTDRRRYYLASTPPHHPRSTPAPSHYSNAGV